MSSASKPWWIDDLKDVCVQFQLDLSCLVDGELDGIPAARAIAHLETCPDCNSFFDDARSQVRAHREIADPEALIERYASLVGDRDTEREIETIELVHRLSTIFYQLGKAYVLTAIDPDFHTRVFEQCVSVEPTQTEGRGFVDGVLASGRDGAGGLDWGEARHMLNGRLARIEDPLEKGRRLLQEAISADPSHEEARLYLAYVQAHEGKTLRAAASYRQIFRCAIDPANRAHAAVQLGRLYAQQEEYRKAIACSRWVILSGLADEDERFFFVRFNLGVYYADLRDRKRSLAAFRELLDRNPERVMDVVEFFRNATATQAVIGLQAGFAEELLEMCPELFRQPEAPTADVVTAPGEEQ